MADAQVHCRHGQGIGVVRYGTQRQGEQRYRWNNVDCPRPIVLV
jgi:hypothetical protein